MVIAPPPAPAPPPPGAARRSCPSTVHLDGRGQLSLGLLPLAGLGIQGTKAKVAVGLERAHAEFVGQGQGLLVVGFGLRGIGGIGVGVDNAKLVQRMRLVPACLVLPGQVECLALRAAQASAPCPARRQTSLS